MTLSGLPDLPRWLAEVRRIARLPDAAALEAVDTLLWSALEEAAAGKEETDWDDELVEEQMDRTRGTVARLRHALREHPTELRLADAEHCRREAEGIGFHAGAEARERRAAHIMELREEARAAAREVECIVLAEEIRAALTLPIANAGAVARIIGQADRALIGLEEREALTPELLRLGREAKLRAVRWRAARKEEDAQIADAGGNGKKATRLRAEARAMLEQDYGKAFPDEATPDS